MQAGSILSTRLIKWTALDQTGAQPGLSFSSSSELPEEKGRPINSELENASRQLRSVVERRVMRMTELHDRIRTAVLSSDLARTK